MELGVADPVPAFNAPAVAHQSQQGFWRGAQAGEKEVGGSKGFAIAAAAGRYLVDTLLGGPGRNPERSKGHHTRPCGRFRVGRIAVWPPPGERCS